MIISAVSGTAGVGKTALAVHWAHRARVRFPDGQMYVNLRGYDPDQPMAAADALAGMLGALGVPKTAIPAGLEERAACYRTLLDGRQMLLLLDNAASGEQVRPLLPGTPSCLVIVTSRDSLAGLVARHGARRLDLDLLPPADAVVLLQALIGDRVDTDPAAAAMLAARCARLPLALRVAAELAASRPATTLAELAAELAGQQQRLDLLDADGDPRTAVRSVFSWSCQHLAIGPARAFQLLGLHPGPSFAAHAAAALTNTTLPRARQELATLTRAHLIHPAGPGRHGMHDLLHAYAAELATTSEAHGECHAALTRLLDHYLAATAAAMDALVPAERDRRPGVYAPAIPVPPIADPAGALAWLDAERPTLVAVISRAATRGYADHATRLAALLYRYLDIGGHHADAMAIHAYARDAARQAGDRTAEAAALAGLGLAHWRQGRHEPAADLYHRALGLFRSTGDRLGEPAC